MARLWLMRGPWAILVWVCVSYRDLNTVLSCWSAALPGSQTGWAGGPARYARGPPRTGTAGTPSPDGRAAPPWRRSACAWAGPGPDLWAGWSPWWSPLHLQRQGERERGREREREMWVMMEQSMVEGGSK